MNKIPNEELLLCLGGGSGMRPVEAGDTEIFVVVSLV